MICQEAGMEAVGMAVSGEDALEQVRRLNPEVVLMDLELETNEAGLKVAEEILQINPQIKIIILTASKDEESMFQAFQLGASDYLGKDAEQEEITACIRDAYHGSSSIRPVAAEKIRREFKRVRTSEQNFQYCLHIIAEMTQTEIDILSLLSQGYSRAEICKIRRVELSTVKTQIKSILKKFNKSSTAEVIQQLNEMKIFDYIRDISKHTMLEEQKQCTGDRKRRRTIGKTFIRVEGTQFTKAGKPMLFCGMGIGSWLNIEHFMVGIPTPDNQIRKTVQKLFGRECAGQFFDSFIKNFITDQDFAFLKSCGVNVVRVPFNYHLFLDDQNPYQYKTDGLQYFDYLLGLCEKYEIYLLPDLHAVPGGQNPDWHSDNDTGIPQFWHYRVFRDQIVGLWKYLADHFRDAEYLLGYDILNEPYLIDAPDILTEFYRDVTRAIRSVDPNHIIFLEGDHFAMQFDCIHEIEDKNTALTFHYYPTVWEPELFEASFDKGARCAKFREILTQIASIREQFGRPVLCGEAGYDIEKDNLGHTLELVDETLTMFEEAGISWTLWCYKDAQFMGMVYPKTETSWMQLVERVHRSWTHYREMGQANELMETIRRIPEFASASDDLCYRMQFRQRGILYRFQSECILEPLLKKYSEEDILALPSSFRFENCEYYEEYAKLLKHHTEEMLKEQRKW
jgi:DNA-binding NarL/FixJ family response regulator